MGNCAGYCNGQGEDEKGQIRQSFKGQGSMIEDPNAFENAYGGKLHLIQLTVLMV